MSDFLEDFKWREGLGEQVLSQFKVLYRVFGWLMIAGNIEYPHVGSHLKRVSGQVQTVHLRHDNIGDHQVDGFPQRSFKGQRKSGAWMPGRMAGDSFSLPRGSCYKGWT